MKTYPNNTTHSHTPTSHTTNTQHITTLKKINNKHNTIKNIQLMIKQAQESGATKLRDDYAKIWLDITQLAQVKFNVHITAKYFRQRFKTIAESLTHDPNFYNWLEGTTPRNGQNAANYAQSN